MFKMIAGFFIGENSKKRIMGVILFLILSIIYFLGFINSDMYLLLIPLIAAFSGMATNARLKKIGLLLIEQKEENDQLKKDMKKLK